MIISPLADAKQNKLQNFAKPPYNQQGPSDSSLVIPKLRPEEVDIDYRIYL